MLELYHWEPAGDSLKVLICLKEKGIEFESRFVDILDFRQYQADFLELSPLGHGPVLVHDGNVLNEPMLLPEYVQEAFPGRPLAPEDPAGWYDVQEWIRYVDAQLNVPVGVLGWHEVMLAGMSSSERVAFGKRMDNVPVKEKQAGWAAVVRDAESAGDRLENARGTIRDAVRRVEDTLQASTWLVGEAYSLADIAAYSVTRVLPQLLPNDVNRQTTPRMLEWLSKIEGRAAVKSALSMRRTPGEGGLFAPA